MKPNYIKIAGPFFIKVDESISSETKSFYEIELNQTKIAGPFFIKLDQSISSKTKMNQIKPK